jgi:phage/plasmid-associated DNA primase
VMYDHRVRDIMVSLEGSHYDLALFLFKEFENEFVCSNIQGKTWYQFNGHVWKRNDTGVELRRKISTFIVSYFQEARRIESEKLRNAGEDEDTGKIEERIKRVSKLIQQLKTNSFKNSIMNECADIFFNNSFEQKLDTNPFLVAFQNGIYDLKDHIFRSGNPNDFISKIMPFDYQEFDNTHPMIIETQLFFSQLFPDSSLREYFLDTMSTIFIGNNTNKLLFVWTGVGDNGKSIMQEIFEHMMGPYAIKLSTSILTGKRTQSSQASPDLSRLCFYRNHLHLIQSTLVFSRNCLVMIHSTRVICTKKEQISKRFNPCSNSH